MEGRQKVAGQEKRAKNEKIYMRLARAQRLNTFGSKGHPETHWGMSNIRWQKKKRELAHRKMGDSNRTTRAQNKLKKYEQKSRIVTCEHKAMLGGELLCGEN